MDWQRIPRIGAGFPFAALSVLAATALLIPLRASVPSSVVLLAYVPVIVMVARFAGVRPSATAAVLAFLAVDLLFVPPYYRLTVASLPEWLALIVFLIVALVSGQQTGQLRQREQAAVRRQDELALLNRLSFRIASEVSVDATAEYVVGEVSELLGGGRAALYSRSESPEGARCLASAGGLAAASDSAVVAWVLREGKAVGLPEMTADAGDTRWISVPADETLSGLDTRAVFLPLQTVHGIEGVLVASPREGGAVAVEDARVLAAVANLCAASLERQRLAGEAAHAAALRETDRLRGTLVSSVSHELKTPLAAATARVTGLLEEEGEYDSERVREELAAVSEDLERLNSSIGDLLDLSRLESAAWEPHFEECEVADILGTVLSRLPRRQRERVKFSLPEDLPPIRADFAQLARALTNLVENALAYSPQDLPILVGAAALPDVVEIWVADSGPGVPDSEKERIFDKFYRGSSASSPPGTGLGLAIAREVVSSHGGAVRVEDVAPRGARFVAKVPRSDEGTSQ